MSNSSIKCNNTVVYQTVDDLCTVVSDLSLLSNDMKIATNKIVSATGFNEYVGGITNDTFSGYIEECGAHTYQLVNDIRQLQITALAVSEDKQAINEFLDRLSTVDYKMLDLTEIESYIGTGRKIKNFFKGLGSSAATLGASIVEGFLDFGETGADLITLGGTSLVSLFTKGHDLLTGDNLTQRMWAETRAKVSEKKVESVFDRFYASSSVGRYIKDNSFAFDSVRSIGKGIGYSSAMIGFSMVTGGLASGGGLAAIGAQGTVGMGQLATTAGVLGFANGAEESWADGATFVNGLGYAAASAGWEAVQWSAGAKINQFGGFGDKIAKSLGGKTVQSVLSRSTLDAADSALEGFVQPVLSTTYKDYGGSNVVENFSTAFEQAGGWKNVRNQAVIGGAMSFESEVKDARMVLKNSSTPIFKANADIQQKQKTYTFKAAEIKNADTGALRAPAEAGAGDIQIVANDESSKRETGTVDGFAIAAAKEIAQLDLPYKLNGGIPKAFRGSETLLEKVKSHELQNASASVLEPVAKPKPTAKQSSVLAAGAFLVQKNHK